MRVGYAGRTVDLRMAAALIAASALSSVPDPAVMLFKPDPCMFNPRPRKSTKVRMSRPGKPRPRISGDGSVRVKGFKSKPKRFSPTDKKGCNYMKGAKP